MERFALAGGRRDDTGTVGKRVVHRTLYRHVEELSRAPGMCGIRLYVHEHNGDATATYKRLGMVSHGYSVLETADRLREPAPTQSSGD